MSFPIAWFEVYYIRSFIMLIGHLVYGPVLEFHYPVRVDQMAGSMLLARSQSAVRPRISRGLFCRLSQLQAPHIKNIACSCLSRPVI